MKKPLSFLSALLLSSAVTISTTACNHQFASKHNLKNILTVTDLGIIQQEYPGTIPSDNELKKQLLNLNHVLSINNISIINKTDNSALVIGDGIFYSKDEIKITYQQQTIDISTLIVDGANIGKFATTGQQPTNQAVRERIHEQYLDLKMEHLIIDVISKQAAIIKGDDQFYTGQVTVSFSIDDSVALNTIIKKNLSVKTNGKDMPVKDDIMTALHNTYQEKLNTAVIDIKINSATNATITSTNQKIYTGEVIVNLNLDISIPLRDVINKGLDKVAISGKIISVTDVNNALAAQYPTLKMNAIEVILQNNNAIIKSLDQKIYTGDEVKINNLLIDLSSVLSNKLPTFIIPGKDVPTREQIITALGNNNVNLNINKIKIDRITDSSVTISGDGKFYSKDNIIVTYNCDKSQPLSEIFKNLNLGTINTNGLPIPSIKAVTSAIANANPDLNINAIQFNASDITDKTVTVNGDGITYQGKIVANFLVDSNTINIDTLSYNHSETNSVGSLKTNWISPDITILSDWTNYAADWDSFSNKFNKLSFGDKSYFSVYCNTYTDQKLTSSQLTVKIKDISADRNKNTFQLNYYYDGGIFGAFLELHGYIHIWHDEKNIYVNINWSIDTVKCFRDRVWNINLQGATFG